MGAYSAQVIADGASHYWRLGEPSGTTAADSVAGGANAPGTISGGVTLGQAGPLADGSTAMLFNGTTGQIVMGPVTTPVVVSLEAWIKTTFFPTQLAFSNIIGGSADAPLRVGTGNGTLFAGGYGVDLGYGVTQINDGVWHHGVFVFDGTTLFIYRDGILDATIASARTGPGTHNGAVGWSAWDPRFWAGAIAEVAVYPLALSPAQIANHYALRTATAGGGGAVDPWPLFAAIGILD